jgi:perosamine synthetase
MYEQRFPNLNAEKAWKRGVSLASAANLVEEDVNFVCDAILEFIGNAR